MKRLKTLCIMLALVVTLTSVTLLPVSAETDGNTIITVPITVQEEYDMAQEFFEILNRNRADAGKYEYILDDRLMDLAMDRAAQCCIYFGHNSLVYSNYDGMSGTYIDKYGKHSTGIFMQEDIAEGLADAQSTYTVWYNSNGHRPLLTDTKNYKYCGIGVVTYHGKREWVLVVSNAPVGNTIGSVSGSRTNTRDIRAKVKYFAGGNITIKGLNKKTDTPFEFADYSGNGNSGYSTADFPSLFTYRNNTPGIIDVDGQGRITTKAAGAGSFTVFYRGTTELCTVNVNVKLSYKDMLALTPTPTPKQTETAAPTQPPKQPETAKPTEPPKQTEVPKQTESPKDTEIKDPNVEKNNENVGETTIPSVAPTQPPKQTETVKPAVTPKPVQPVKPVSKKFTVKTKNVTYNGKAQKPSVTVYVGKKKLSRKYYSVAYKNNKNVGYGTVTVKGKGRYAKYSGAATFKVNLKKVSLSSVKARKKKMVVYWKKTGGNQGYQVQYSTSKRFSSNVKTVRLSAGKKSVTIKNIPAKKRYYVRIRSYKKVGNKIWYTGWSKVKTVKTK